MHGVATPSTTGLGLAMGLNWASRGELERPAEAVHSFLSNAVRESLDYEMRPWGGRATCAEMQPQFQKKNVHRVQHPVATAA